MSTAETAPHHERCCACVSDEEIDAAARRVLAEVGLAAARGWYVDGCGSRIAHESGVVLVCAGRHFPGWPHRSAGGVVWADGDDRLVGTGVSFRDGRGV